MLQNSLQDQTTQTETIEDFTINSNTLTEKSSENRISYSENTTQTDPISFLPEESSSETVVLTQKSEKIVRTTCCSNNIFCNGSSNIKDSVTQDYSDIGYQSDVSDFSSPFPNKQQIQSLQESEMKPVFFSTPRTCDCIQQQKEMCPSSHTNKQMKLKSRIPVRRTLNFTESPKKSITPSKIPIRIKPKLTEVQNDRTKLHQKKTALKVTSQSRPRWRY